VASSLKNLSDFSNTIIPNGKGFKLAVVVAEWNHNVTHPLSEGALNTLINNGVNPEDVKVSYVPGAFELALGAQYHLEKHNVDAVICIGCVIQGDTKHFDFICNGATQGIMDLNLKYNKPVIFGILTPNTLQQALDRAGGIHGNKGDEAAVTALQMIALKKQIL
jgi:6,7-dimethyl-8-ribityllumazine synthase